MNRPHRGLLTVAALLGLSAVAFGAFGAHALANVFAESADPRPREWWDTAAHYHLIHALAVALAALATPSCGSLARLAGYGFALGTLIFSGTLYAMALGAARFLGAVTPLGGTILLVAWGLLAVSAIRAPKV